MAWDEKAILDGDKKSVETYLRASRADVFTDCVNRRMKEGRRVDLERMLSSLPTDEGRRAGDLADYLALRTRLPNFFGRAQAHLDGLCRNLMPYALPDVLQAAFATPLGARKGGRAVRSFIRQEAPRLATIPLARGSVTVPFWLSEKTAYLWSVVKRRVGLTYENPTRSNFLDKIEPWVRDAIRSISVRQYEPYDNHRIQALVEGYYEGNRSNATALDWWVAFECWRRTLQV